jgi:hypothetical protein
MAAGIIIHRWTGTTASPTLTNITSANTRASTSDSASPGTSNPIPIPTDASTNYSFWVSTRLACTAISAGTVDNIRWYTDGTTFGTGITTNVGVATAYTTAAGTAGSSGIVLNTSNYPSLTGATVQAFTYVSTAALTVGGSASAVATGGFGNFVVYQLAVTSAASGGTLAAETFTFKYDDTSS